MEAAQSGRAVRHAAVRTARRALRAWATLAADDAAARTAAASADATRRQAAVDLALLLEAADRDAAASAARAAAAAEAAQYADFLAEAEAAAERARQEEAATSARAAATARRLLDAQAAAHAAALTATRAAFDAEWDGREAAQCAEARVRTLAWLQRTREGAAALAAEVDRLVVLADCADNVAQPGSDFTPVYDPADGCVHFVRPAGAGGVPPSRDINVDAMTRGEGAEVASAYLAARAAEARRADLARERAAAWGHATAVLAATAVQRSWRARQARRAALTVAARTLEVVVDVVIIKLEEGSTTFTAQSTSEPTNHSATLQPRQLQMTLSLAYLHTPTGARFQRKPAAFGSMVVQPPPEWVAVPHSDCNAAGAIDIGRGTHSYHNVQQPWVVLESPPSGVALCSGGGHGSGCGGHGVATRCCPAPGCEGALYCFACFAARHAAGAGSDHWVVFERVPAPAAC